jgi:hypothetical protein
MMELLNLASRNATGAVGYFLPYASISRVFFTQEKYWQKNNCARKGKRMFYQQ